ncbi:cytochrome c oxidase subunit II [Acidobacteriota bacterium]
MDPVSDVAREVDRAFWIIGGISLALLVCITVAMVVFVIKFHRSKARTTRQFKVHYPVEITWTVLPTLLVIFMFFVGYKGFKMMRDVPEDAEVIEVIAQQWSWTFIYPEEGVSSNRLYVSVDKPVKFELTSTDVIHSFYIPSFRIKEDAVPGKKTYMWIQAKKPGRYNIFCAEFCGRDHSMMYTDLIVLPEQEYQSWIEKKIADKNKPVVIEQAMDPESEEIKSCGAQDLYLTYCASCHGKDGQGALVEGARNFHKLEGWKKSPKITDIFRTLTEGIQGTQMRSFSHIPAWDRFALAHHVASFIEDPDPPVATLLECQELSKEYNLEKPLNPQKGISIDKAMELMAQEAAQHDTP